jgi:hypothetical protein
MWGLSEGGGSLGSNTQVLGSTTQTEAELESTAETEWFK